MSIDFIAAGSHFAEHLAPVYLALPESHRGQFFVKEKGITASVAERVKEYGITPVNAMHMQRGGGPVVVASSTDHSFANLRRRPMAYLNHGIGQTARHPNGSFVNNSSYVGTRARRNVALFLCPGPYPAGIMREIYPRAITVEVGAPKMDKWHGYKPHNETPVITCSFHWDAAHIVPEFGSAWREFIDVFCNLKGYQLYGHAHPRIAGLLKGEFEQRGVKFLEHFDEVLKVSDLYINENSSTLYEFASTGRPVVVLNPSFFRRNVWHGLRFWDAAHVGINCDHPGDLQKAVELALSDSSEQQAARHNAVNQVYSYTDGCASVRAAQALVRYLT